MNTRVARVSSAIWWVMLLAVLSLVPGRRCAAEEGKSAEEILNSLLGTDRGIGGVRRDQPPGMQAKDSPPAGQTAGGRIAVPIQFEYNSAEITTDSYDQLRRIAIALKDARLSAARVRVEGHTDKTGSDEYNLTLSQRRADAVKRYLVEKEGIPAGHLEAKGYGKNRPLPDVSQDTEMGRAVNRRVELVNLGSASAMATNAAPEPKVAAEHRLSVDVVVYYEAGGKKHVLAPGSVLTPSDNYRVTFTPTRDSYVYVFQIDPDGKADRVFPNDQYSEVRNPVRGQAQYSVPPEGRWVSLDANPGEGEIVVLASDTELSDPAAVAVRMRTPQFDVATRGVAAGVRADVAGQPPAGVFAYRLPFKQQ